MEATDQHVSDNNTKRVQTKFLTFQVPDGLHEVLATSIQRFAENRSANCVISVENEMIIRTLTRHDLREGMKTLQKLLSMDKTLTLKPSCQPFPDAFLREKMPRGVDNARILLLYGKVVEDILTKHALTYRAIKNGTNVCCARRPRRASKTEISLLCNTTFWRPTRRSTSAAKKNAFTTRI